MRKIDTCDGLVFPAAVLGVLVYDILDIALVLGVAHEWTTQNHLWYIRIYIYMYKTSLVSHTECGDTDDRHGACGAAHRRSFPL